MEEGRDIPGITIKEMEMNPSIETRMKQHITFLSLSVKMRGGMSLLEG
jgi:hypothetical protein